MTMRPRADSPTNGTADPTGSRPRWEGSPEAVARAEQEAAILRDLSGSGYLGGSLGAAFGKAVTSAGYKAYRDQILRDAGSPTDPVEIMILEQLALAHHNVGRLYTRAAKAQNLEAVKLYHEAVSRLLGEFRRLALAIKAYRAPSASPQADSQYAAEDDSQVESDAPAPAHVDRNGHAKANGRKNGSTTKQGSNRLRSYLNGHPKPPPGRGRASEQTPAAAAVS